VLTLSKVVVEVGNRADAARAGDYRLELEAAPEAYARTDYQLAEQGLQRRTGRESSSLWLGTDDALAQFGVKRGQAIERDGLIAVLQGQHVETGEQLRRPGVLKREARDEHGQNAIIESVDSGRDTLTLLLREPGAEPRLVEVDQQRLRREHDAGKRAAAVRLNYALHSFPAQGATVHGTATLAGHWSQAKQETYVGDTRAIHRHSVHIAREDLGADGSDEDRIGRYAQRISHSRQRHASIRHTLDPTRRLAVELPDHQPLPGVADVPAAIGSTDPSPETSTSTRDTSAGAALSAAAGDTSRQTLTARHTRPLRPDDDPPQPEHARADPLIAALGPPPQERIARERWDRHARRLTALGPQAATRPAPTEHTPPSAAISPRAPSSPPTTPQRHSNPTLHR
jgi:hypothetical protein